MRKIVGAALAATTLATGVQLSTPVAAVTAATTMQATTAQAATTQVTTTQRATTQRTVARRSAYVRSVLRDRPTALLKGLRDVAGGGARGTAIGGPSRIRMPNGDPAYRFNGHGQYLQFANRRAFEIAATGALTVEFWMRPDVLQFARTEGSGYVYTMGKGSPGQHEWYTRMYSRTNAENRPNRISGYAFNPAGGLGAGSYFQDVVRARRWIHVTLVVNANARSSRYPMGYTRIYKNGVLRDTDSLADYGITPRSGSAPLRIGTGYLNSFFQGAVGDVAFYDHEVSGARIHAHYVARR
jgi:hypothetical protein